jgi:hypothetical protein
MTEEYRACAHDHPRIETQNGGAIMKADKSQQLRTLVSCMTMIVITTLLAATAAESFKVLAA